MRSSNPATSPSARHAPAHIHAMNVVKRLAPLLLLVANAASTATAATTNVFHATFESTAGDDNWVTDPAGVNTATAGKWTRGDNPTQAEYSSNGFVAQRLPFAGTYDFVTGNSGDNLGTNTAGDVDGGVTTARSPNFTLPTGVSSATLSFRWFLGASGTGLTGDDFFRVRLVDTSGTVLETVLERIPTTGVNAQWTAASADLSAHLGKTVFLRVEAADLGVDGSIIEAAVDEVLVTAETPDPGQISGVVFRDYDGNGLRDSAEPGVGGIVVTAFRPDGTAVSPSVTTDFDGTYVLSNLVDGTEYRIEFSNIPDYLEPGVVGPDSQSTVTFVSSPALNVSLALNNPSQFSDTTSPQVTLACYEGGTGITNTGPGFVSFPFGQSGRTPMPNKDFEVQELGSVWGSAWDAGQSRMFVTSFLKRHVGFADGPGFVYILDYSAPAAPTLTGSFDLQGVSGVEAGSVDRSSGPDYTLDNDPTVPTIDLDSFGKIGKMSFGNAAMEEDLRHLWIVNTFDDGTVAGDHRSLIRVDVGDPSLPTNGGQPAAALVDVFKLKDLSGVPVATNGTLRPWAVAFHDGLGYVGVVNDAASGSQADLRAYVLSFDPATLATTGFTTVFDFSLSNAAYPREPVFYAPSQTPPDLDGRWRPWISTWAGVSSDPWGPFFWYAPQPILSDIDFASDGSMLIGMLDRFGHQSGIVNHPAIAGTSSFVNNPLAAGDMLHACFTESGFRAGG